MSRWYNPSGQPLSSLDWLEVHHQAKLPERRRFVSQIVARRPNRIVDLASGPGLWLELLAEQMPEAELWAVDIDELALQQAHMRMNERGWQLQSVLADINGPLESIPSADVFLLFNAFPYVSDIGGLLDRLSPKLLPGGSIVVRQYDGTLIRFGPLNDAARAMHGSALRASLGASAEIEHFSLDKVFEALQASSMPQKEICFETFHRVSPFTLSERRYLENCIEWELRYTSERAKKALREWLPRERDKRIARGAYLVEVDLVAWLS